MGKSISGDEGIAKQRILRYAHGNDSDYPAIIKKDETKAH